ncbi:MAG: NAD(P)-binding protein, partial [Usitatibacteraceae bacterium]
MSVAKNPAASIAVVGGGYAGLASAVTLAEAGVSCTVFETGKTLGGRARRVDYRCENIDNGQHILVGAYTETLRLISLVGVADSALRRLRLRLSVPPKFLLNVPHSAFLPGPLALAWALLSAKGLSFADKLAAIRMLRALKRCSFRVNPTESVADLLANHSQPQNLIDYLWHPLTISALNTPLADASAQIFANVLRDSFASDRAASDLLLPRVDLTALFPDPAAEWVSRRGGEVRR